MDSEKQNDVKYVLTMTPKQISVVERACELYSRIRLGQFDVIEQEFCWPEEIPNDKKDAYFAILNQIKTNFDNLKEIISPIGSNGFIKDERCEISWNMYQAMRYERSWHEHPEGGTTVNFNDPLDFGGVGMPTCHVVTDILEQTDILQKPLSFEEGRKCKRPWIYVELKNLSIVFRVPTEQELTIERDEKSYNVTFRYWIKKPSDKERDAAPWKSGQ